MVNQKKNVLNFGRKQLFLLVIECSYQSFSVCCGKIINGYGGESLVASTVASDAFMLDVKANFVSLKFSTK